MNPARGELWRIELREHPDLAEWGDRFGVVVSNDFFNARLNTVVVVPTTRKTERADEAGCVSIPVSAVTGAPGLAADSVALCHSPLTLPTHLLSERCGRLDPKTLSEVEDVIAFALDLAPAME